MARLKSALKLVGAVGGLVFYRTEHGDLVRAKGDISAKRVRTDPKYARTRQANAEFARQGKAVRLLRNAFFTSFRHARDINMTGRMTREMVRIIHRDAVNLLGERKVMNENAGLLEGFDFNANAQFQKIFSASYTSTVDRMAGEVLIHFPSFVPKHDMVAPKGASYVRIISHVAAIDFEKNSFTENRQETGLMRLDADLTPEFNVRHEIAKKEVLPVIVAIGVAFYQVVNGNIYFLNNGTYNSLSIARVFV